MRTVQAWPCRAVRHAPTRQVAAHAAGGDTNLAQKRCEPCEASHDALDQMGLAMIMDQATAERFRAQVCWMARKAPAVPLMVSRFDAIHAVARVGGPTLAAGA